MAIKPINANFELKNLPSEVRNASVSAIPLNVPNVESNPENAAAIENENSASRYAIIKNQSLNPLKPIVIANTEFVHIGSGEDPDSSGLKAQFGDGNVVSVNSVIKLFEIQRIIRGSSLKNATFLLDVAKGYDNLSIMKAAKKKMQEIFDDIIDDDINVTIDNFVEKSKRQFSLDRRTKRDAGQENEGSIFGLSRQRNLKLRGVASEKGNDPYFRAMVEYVAYQKILLEAIRYLSGILRIKDDALKQWSVYEATSVARMQDIEIQTSSEEVKQLLEKSNIYSVGAHNVQKSADEAISGILRIETTSDTPDTTLFLQTFASTFDRILLRRSYDMESRKDRTLRIGRRLKIALDKDAPVQRAFLELQKSWLIGMYNSDNLLDYPYNESPYSGIDSTVGEVSNTGFNHSANTATVVSKILKKEEIDGGFGEERLDRILSFFPDTMTDSEIYGELLGAMILNDSIHASSFVSDGMSSSLTTLGTATTGLDAVGYFERLFGLSLVQNFIGVPDRLDEGNKADMPLNTTFGFQAGLIEDTSGGSTANLGSGAGNTDRLATPLLNFVRIRKESDFDYAPLESTQKLENGDYITGPNFFIDVALQQGDLELKSLEAFTKKYKLFAEQYALDVDKRTLGTEATDAFDALMNSIGDSLLGIAGDYQANLFRFAMIVKFSKTRKNLIKAYKTAYMGEKTSDLRRGRADAYGDPFMNKTRSEFARTVGDGATGLIRTQQQSRARATLVMSDGLLRKFMKEALNVRNLKLGDRNNDAFTSLGTSGGQDADFLTHADDQEYTKEDSDFNKINGIKTINTGTGEDQSNKKQYKIKKKTQKGELNNEHVKLRQGLRIGGQFMSDFFQNKHFDDNVFKGDIGRRSAFNRSRPGILRGRIKETDSTIFGDDEAGRLTQFDNVFPRSINRQGGVYALSEHHRAFILYAFVAKILQSTISIKANSQDPKKTNRRGKKKDKKDNAFINIIGNKDELRGVAKAFQDRGSSRSFQNYASEPRSFKEAYSRTTRHINYAFNSLRSRVRDLQKHALIPLFHAQMIENFRKNAQKYIQAGDGSALSRAAINLLQDENVQAFERSLGLLTEESVSDMYNSYANTFVNKKDTIFTPEDAVDNKSAKLMIKILTNPGYGFLSSEKRGNPTVCHVGLTNSMLSVMRLEAYKKSRNTAFLTSKRFCVNIFKRNEIDTSEVVYPKTFLFDSKLQIHDYNQLGEPLNHIENYSDTWNFEKIINNMEFTTWTDFIPDPSATQGGTTRKTAYRTFRATGEELLEDFQNTFPRDFRVTKDLLINHINDYALKRYYRYSIGVDFETYNFVLNANRINFQKRTGGFSGDPEETRANFDELIEQIVAAYPAANIDQVLSSELFRSIKTIGASPIYSLGEKTKRVLLPKKFDRVISIPYCDKDFILYTPAYDVEFADLFKTEPTFSYTSKISRPDLAYGGLGSSSTTAFGLDFRDPLEKYRDNCKQDFPEVSSTYVTITILPNGES